MTMPCERTRAVNNTRQFLVDLQSDLSAPDAVRKEASRCLRHYPGEYYMELSQEHLPEVWGEPNE
jgi:hypothetical protein